MPIFVRKNFDNHFDAEASFEVKESSGASIIAGCVLIVIFLFAYLKDAFNNSITILLITIGVLIIPALYFIKRGSSKAIVMTINKNGFYHYGKLITNWNNFIDVAVKEEEKMLSITDNFALFIKYYKDGEPGYFGRKIKLTNTQNRAEEEIIAAIKFYYQQNKKLST